MNFSGDSSLEAVLFDLDGTLANSSQVLKQAYLDFLSVHGLVGSAEEFEELIGPSIKEIVSILKARRHIPQALSTLEQQYLEILATEYGSNVPCYGGATEILALLKSKGVRLAIVTSAPSILTNSFLESQNLIDYFSVITTADSVLKSKPSPEIYKATLFRLNITPECAIAVEDSPNGVLSGVSAGIKVVGVSTTSTPGALSSAGAFITVSDLHELRAWFQNLLRIKLDVL